MEINWTEDQCKIFDLENFKDGKLIVKACPGSGKTLCVSERIIRFINEHENNQSGLAILSFTNVAIDEINERYEKETNEKIVYPHFIGTIDSFINKYIFLPFGHLVMKCNKRPILVGEPYAPWHHKLYNDNFFDKISYSMPNRKIVKIGQRFDLTPAMMRSKMKYTREGYATQEDANYFAIEILEKYPEIAKSIICKFPYMIIDEAQDMSSKQMKILDLLIENGLQNILLVGDPDQAIFKWRTAEPELFIQKYNQWNEKYETGIKLKYTFRCNKNISKYLSKLSKSEVISKSNDPYDFKPKIISHNNNYEEIAKEFLNDVKSITQDIDKTNTAVLFRQKDGLKKLFKNNAQHNPNRNIFKNIQKDLEKLNKDTPGIQLPHFNNVQNYTENIIKGEYYLLQGDLFNGFKEFEKAYIKIEFNEYNNIQAAINQSIVENGFYKHRVNVWDFINSFNKPLNKNQLIDEWITSHNQNFLDKKSKIYLNNIKTKDKKLKIKLNETLTWDNLSISIQRQDIDYYYGTIHIVKGKTFDSVLLILNSNYGNQLGKELIDNEELRNIYVGMSRAKHILYIAVPENDYGKWKDYFEPKFIQTTLIL